MTIVGSLLNGATMFALMMSSDSTIWSFTEPVEKPGFRHGELSKMLVETVAGLEVGQAADVTEKISSLANLYATVSKLRMRGVIPKNAVGYTKKGRVYVGLEEL